MCGLTTRTLRYWEELGLIRPSSYRGRGRASLLRRRHGPGGADPRSAGAARLLPLGGPGGARHRGRRRARPGSLRVPLGRGPTERRRELLDEAIEANDKLLERLDTTLARIGTFRDERAAKAVRLRETCRELDEEGRPARGDLPSARRCSGMTGCRVMGENRERCDASRDRRDQRRRRGRHRGLPRPAAGRAPDRFGGGDPPHARYTTRARRRSPAPSQCTATSPSARTSTAAMRRVRVPTTRPPWRGPREACPTRVWWATSAGAAAYLRSMSLLERESGDHRLLLRRAPVLPGGVQPAPRRRSRLLRRLRRRHSSRRVSPEGRAHRRSGRQPFVPVARPLRRR